MLLVVGLFALVTALRVAVDDASEGIAALYVLPVAVVAINWSRRTALLAAGLAFVLFGAGNLLLDHDIGPVGYATRAVLFVAGALLVSEYALRAKRTEDFTQAVLQNLGEGVGVADATGRLIFFNRENERIVGLPADAEIPADEWSDHFQVLDPVTCEPIATEDLPMVRALGGERVRGAPLLISPRGQEPRYTVANADPVIGRDGKQLGAVVSLRDETERRAVEERIQQILESMADAYIGMDANGVITAWNPQAEKVFGWSAEEAIGSTVEQTIVPEHLRAKHHGGLAHFNETGEGPVLGQRLELPALTKAGAEIPIELTISVLKGADGPSFHAFLHDISDRKAREQSQGQLAAIVETSEDAISTTTLDGTIATWNAGAERLFGYTAGEAIGRPMAMLLPAEVRKGGEAILRRIAGGERIDSFEFEVVRKDGAQVPVSLTAAPVFDADGKIVRAAAIIRDVSERREAEAEAEELKSQFFALVSHELRTPLTSILGYADLMNEDDEAGDLPETGSRYLEIIRRNSQRLDRLVQDLLLVAQVEAGRFSVQIGEADIGELARDCIDQSRPGADEKGVELSLESEPPPPFAGDAIRLSQVLDNLVSNAIKFTPEGGSVTLRVGEESGRCVIEVADTGAGIEPDELEHLFDRFYRASAANKAYVKGVGLGLAITKAIVEGHDGKIEIESEPGEGSVFRVLIPIRERSVEVEAEKQASHEGSVK